MKPFLLHFAGFLILHGTAVGQPGFSNWFDFGLAANFHNIVLKEDTLFIAGTAKDPATSQWGALFVKMETNGVIANYRLHLDSTGASSGWYAKW